MSGRRPHWSLLTLLAFVALLAGGLAYLGTWPPYVQVLSDSMEPEIEVGDIVLLKDLDRPPQVDDIVAIRVPEVFQDRLPPVVIHRIIAIQDGEAQTKGDNIDTPDPFLVPVDGLDTRVLVVLPGAAQILAFLRSPFGLMWVVTGVFLLVILPIIDAQKQRVALAATSLQSTDQLAAELRKLRDDTETILGIHRQDDVQPLRAVTIDVHGHLGPPQPEAGEPPVGGLEPFRRPERLVVQPDDQTLAMIGEVQEHLARATEEDGEVKETIGELVGAVGQYGEHLRSHTAILRSMSAASADLAEVVGALKGALGAEPSASPELPQEVPPNEESSFLTELLAVAPSDGPTPAEASTDRLFLDQLLEAFRSSPSGVAARPPIHESDFLDDLANRAGPQDTDPQPDPDPEDPAPWLDIVRELFPIPDR